MGAMMSTGTLKGAIYNNYAANNTNDAINTLYNTDHHSVIIYATSEENLMSICKEVYEIIKQRNAEIPEVDDQMLPTYPSRFDAVYNCLPAYCAEISMGVFKEAAGHFYVASSPDYSVLTDPKARKPLSEKARSSLAMMMCMMADARR